MPPDLAATAEFAPPDAADVEAFADAIGATAVQVADLMAFKGLLSDWNQKFNLVGPSALGDFWRRHALDSAQLLALEPKALKWVDIGSGAGFPGLVLAILLKGVAGAHVDLIESSAKRCEFLSTVATTLSLPTRVRNGRAEALAPSPMDVVTARACAPMSRLFQFASPHLRRAGKGLFLKGQGVEAELNEARRDWRFKSDVLQSRSDPSGRIVSVQGLSHV